MTLPLSRRKNHVPLEPKPGRLPTLTYTYTEENGAHRVECSCGDFLESTADQEARNFARSHIGEHAKYRIVSPEPEEEAE